VNPRDEQLRVQQAVSAGGVIYRETPRGIEVVLCGRAAEHLWGLPKGTPEASESLRETALREVREESGLGVVIVGDLGFIEYEFVRPSQGTRFKKVVHHFLMRPDGTGSTDQHDHEYDRVEWFPIEQALGVMTYRNEADVVERALGEIRRLQDDSHVDSGQAAGAAL
jgi:8-oxo-dGTP pyrophosphatase MutT (NUDIX family)